jgi:hypothetical protein
MRLAEVEDMARPRKTAWKRKASAIGISNRALGDEQQRQQSLPPRGSRRREGGTTQRFVEPTRARRRGRGLKLQPDTPGSAPSADAARSGPPAPTRRVETVASARPPIVKANRRVTSDPTEPREL